MFDKNCYFFPEQMDDKKKREKNKNVYKVILSYEESYTYWFFLLSYANLFHKSVPQVSNLMLRLPVQNNFYLFYFLTQWYRMNHVVFIL